MKNLFVPFEIAKQLKEKGFNQSCFVYYETPNTLNFMDTHFGYIIPTDKDGLGLSAPLYQQVVDWFREKHKIIITIRPFNKGETFFSTVISNDDNITSGSKELTYFEAFNRAIEEALKLI